MGGILTGPLGFGGAVSALNPVWFDRMICRLGQRISWMKGHACPCTFGGAGANGELPIPGSAQRSCLRCLGLGFYWDDPTIPFVAWIKFVEMSPTPDEPGVRVDESYGTVQLAEPSLTIPYSNPFIAANDDAQSTTAWTNASVDDMFVAVDSLARFTAKLQVGQTEYLPYQQNLQIAPSGAVTTWNPDTRDVEPVARYSVSGAAVRIEGYPDGTGYMVEFLAAPQYVAFRPAGGIPHVRPFGAGLLAEPRRFKLQQLDFWTRQRGQGQQAPGSAALAGTAYPQVVMTGRLS